MLKKWWKAAQIYMDKRMLTMIALGFSSGFPLLLVFGTLNLWLKDAGISYAAIESPTPNVREAFCSALNTGLTMQDGIYQQMTQKGWYQVQQAPQSETQQLKQKFPQSC